MTCKIYVEHSKTLKPELDHCPFCDFKLKYKYTISNKIIQFHTGNAVRIKNLGYGCSNLDCKHYDLVHSSQTAAKYCFKGYTYSTEVIALIALYKEQKFSRDKILLKLYDMNVKISDRNIDLIYNKYKERLAFDYKKNVNNHYKYMLEYYGSILLSIDCIILDDIHSSVIIRSFFNNELLGFHIVNTTESCKYNFLDDYIQPTLNISHIATVNPDNDFFPYIKNRVNDNVKFVSYLNY
ncbi:MAG: hypothetical protein ACRC5M_06525 [Anaeroplasmataceae bacterium]